MQTVKIDRENTQLIAHRGLSGIEPENTQSAFVAAGKRDYFGIETDVHVTADKRFVVIHDNTTERVSRKNINIEKSTFDEIRKIRLNGKRFFEFHQIPSLEEYIEICKEYRKKSVIELKNKFTADDIKRLIEEIKALHYLDNVIFISFSFNNMIVLRELLPKQSLQFLCAEINGDVIKKLNDYSLDVDVSHIKLTKKDIDEVHSNNHLINVWTVDRRERAEELISYGVDFITTNILV